MVDFHNEWDVQEVLSISTFARANSSRPILSAKRIGSGSLTPGCIQHCRVKATDEARDIRCPGEMCTGDALAVFLGCTGSAVSTVCSVSAIWYPANGAYRSDEWLTAIEWYTEKVAPLD